MGQQCNQCLVKIASQDDSISRKKVVPFQPPQQQGIAEMKQNYMFEGNLKILGVGNYCKVLLTQSVVNPTQQVAIKVIDKLKISEDLNLNHIEILDQLRNLMVLDHKGVVRYFEIYHDVSSIYLVMEYLDGQSIEKYFADEKRVKRKIKDKQWFEQKLLKFFQQALQALAHCHSQGVLHQDLQPENIIITKSNKVKLIGLGVRNKGSGKKILGFPTYMAPEITEGNTYSEKADIWSLGIFLHILIAGKSPFIMKALTGKTVQPTQVQTYFKQATVSYHVLSVCTDMLNILPEDRPQAKDIIKSDWFKSQDEDEDEKELQKQFKVEATQVILRLQKFKGGSQLKRAALVYLVKISSHEELDQAGKVFEQIDKDCTGIINATELKHYITKFKLGLSDRQILAMIQELDYNSDKQINYSEFLAATMDTKKLITEEKLRSVFSVFDTANKGAFSTDNMRFGFEKIGIKLSLDKAQEIMTLHGILPKENLSFETFREIIAPNIASALTMMTQVSVTHQSLDKTNPAQRAISRASKSTKKAPSLNVLGSDLNEASATHLSIDNTRPAFRAINRASKKIKKAPSLNVVGPGLCEASATNVSLGRAVSPDLSTLSLAQKIKKIPSLNIVGPDLNEASATQLSFERALSPAQRALTPVLKAAGSLGFLNQIPAISEVVAPTFGNETTLSPAQNVLSPALRKTKTKNSAQTIGNYILIEENSNHLVIDRALKPAFKKKKKRNPTLSKANTIGIDRSPNPEYNSLSPANLKTKNKKSVQSITSPAISVVSPSQRAQSPAL